MPKVDAIDVAPTEDPDTIKSHHWLLVRTGAWRSIGHWLGAPPTGRFQHDITGKVIEVRTAAEWFGSTPITPPQARKDKRIRARVTLEDEHGQRRIIKLGKKSGYHATDVLADMRTDYGASVEGWLNHQLQGAGARARTSIPEDLSGFRVVQMETTSFDAKRGKPERMQ